ncbi:MAG: hypothetical protein IK079_05630 [Desulfovibrio sp.]|nr:hypothetical protein [Desulfovibrio sp.]
MKNRGLLMLDKALDLAEQEKKAMENNNYEDAIALSRERGQMTSEAWDFFQSDVREEYLARLLRLRNFHEILTGIALQAHSKVQKSLQRSRQEQRRMRGYQQAVSQALQ